MKSKSFLALGVLFFVHFNPLNAGYMKSYIHEDTDYDYETGPLPPRMYITVDFNKNLQEYDTETKKKFSKFNLKDLDDELEDCLGSHAAAEFDVTFKNVKTTKQLDVLAAILPKLASRTDVTVDEFLYVDNVTDQVKKSGSFLYSHFEKARKKAEYYEDQVSQRNYERKMERRQNIEDFEESNGPRFGMEDDYFGSGSDSD